MKPFDKLLFGLIFGASFPLFFFLIAITLYYFFQGVPVYYFVVPGLAAGLITDVLFLKRLVRITLDLPAWAIIGFFLFYNICMYGMFMGFPVFNLVMGAVAGYYFGIKINRNNSTVQEIENIKKRVSLFTGLIMSLICISTALIALTEKTICEELQGMLGLKFRVTMSMIISLILVGGAFLIVAQYFLTKIVMTLTIKTKL